MYWPSCSLYKPWLAASPHGQVGRRAGNLIRRSGVQIPLGSNFCHFFISPLFFSSMGGVYSLVRNCLFTHYKLGLIHWHTRLGFYSTAYALNLARTGWDNTSICSAQSLNSDQFSMSAPCDTCSIHLTLSLDETDTKSWTWNCLRVCTIYISLWGEVKWGGERQNECERWELGESGQCTKPLLLILILPPEALTCSKPPWASG